LAVCAQALPRVGVADTKPATTTTSFAIVSWTRQEFGRKASHSNVPQGTIVERPQRHHRPTHLPLAAQPQPEFGNR
jgi:hypothetical protein